ncbi:MAG TPA: GAF domain-containing protein [Tissierellaceae bacterium]|jgi:GAF domain-containing protein|nr:GAF domain-containing protein [Tissierellaceae bacterium]
MIKVDAVDKMNEEERLKYMLLLLKGQVGSEKDVLANISNVTAIIKACVDDLNWAGFYLMKRGELVLGPFQGLPACNRIQVGKGVCGRAIEEGKTQLVPDVHLFPGHIACDSASNSELVVPIIKKGKAYGVLDLDSPSKDRFKELHRVYFERLVDILNQHTDWDRVTE